MKKHYLHTALTIVLAVTLVVVTVIFINVNEDKKFLKSNVDTQCYSEFASFCQGCRVNWDGMDEETRARQKEENLRHLYTALQLYSYSSYSDNQDFGLLLGYLYQLSLKGELYDIMDDDNVDRLNYLYPHIGKEDGPALAKDAYDRLAALAVSKEQE